MALDWDKLVLAPAMGVFGEDQLPTYTPQGGAPFLLACAVFDAEYEEVNTVPDDGPAQTARRPILGVRLSLFTVPPAQNDTVFIPSMGRTYIVRDVRPDGHGHAKLILMEAA